MARPKKEAKDQMSDHLHIVVTRQQRDKLNRIAKAETVTPSIWVRQQIERASDVD